MLIKIIILAAAALLAGCASAPPEKLADSDVATDILCVSNLIEHPTPDTRQLGRLAKRVRVVEISRQTSMITCATHHTTPGGEYITRRNHPACIRPDPFSNAINLYTSDGARGLDLYFHEIAHLSETLAGIDTAERLPRFASRHAAAWCG